MAWISTAVTMVTEYIVALGLYSFKSLTEETQRKLISAYGSDFEQKVNAQLTM